MRSALSNLITQAAIRDPNFIVLSGDHGYTLFDNLKASKPSQFVNCGVAEQGMVGIAAGLARSGFRPLVYGLASFIPIRVLEQIKIDVCASSLPVIFLGDGAGVVYSTLGLSHHSAEDVACLSPLPNIKIYSPCDEYELESAFQEALAITCASYIRLGKSDRPSCHSDFIFSPKPHLVHTGHGYHSCIIATGSLVSIAIEIAKKYGLDAISVPRLKPLDASILKNYASAIILEEHSQHGGLFSLLSEKNSQMRSPIQLFPITLENKFAERCGSYQYALSEHGLSDNQIMANVDHIIRHLNA